jgi:hypothetical protein
MRPIDPAGLLQAWEEAVPLSLPGRALRLVATTADPPAALSELESWSVRQRDAALFELRRWMFGAEADGVVPCPTCDEPLEMRFDLDRLRPAPDRDGNQDRQLRIGDLAVTFRQPRAADLMAVAAEDDEARARADLLARCVTGATRGTASVPLDLLDEAALDGVACALAEADADLAPTFVLECPACGRRGEVPFAIDAFVWREVDAWARHTLWEVHLLAQAYGWSEPEILALSPTRRRLYLEWLGHA